MKSIKILFTGALMMITVLVSAQKVTVNAKEYYFHDGQYFLNGENVTEFLTSDEKGLIQAKIAEIGVKQSEINATEDVIKAETDNVKATNENIDKTIEQQKLENKNLKREKKNLNDGK